MKPSLRQKLLIAVGISAGLLASFNLFAQQTPAPQYTINSQTEYLQAVESIQELAATLYSAHANYPQLQYSHIYNSDGSLMGFNVTGVPQSTQADKISVCLMQLEALGNAVHNMDAAYLPETNEKLSSRVSKKEATKTVDPNATESTVLAPGAFASELIASNK
jgi:hypothetical protein